MTDVTELLQEIRDGRGSATDELLPLVYAELQQLAHARLRHEQPGQTLQATALVHEAYLRLVKDVDALWDSKGHFFSAAAEAMRRILIERARRRKTQKHGGDMNPISIDEGLLAIDDSPDHMLALDEALERLEKEDSLAAETVKLRAFAGLSMEDTANALGIAKATAYRHWSYARAWLIAETGPTE